MDATTRLAGIEARCKALGWDMAIFNVLTRHIAEMIHGHTYLTTDEQAMEAAERLLSCYEPGQVITLGRNYSPILLDSPKPGKYKLVRWDDGD